MITVYRATLTVTTEANLDDAGLDMTVDVVEQVVEGPVGEALVEAIIQALGEPDTFDVTLV